MKSLQNNLKIGISGLGLIGGSIYKNLKTAGFNNIVAQTSNVKTKISIENDGFVASDNVNILKDCELIFVCSPISETVNSIKKIFEINRHAIFVDVASLKADILREIEQIQECKFIGSHPMAGTENTGYEASFSELFEDAIWVLAPSSHVTTEDIEMLKEVISFTGAKTIEIDPIEHDKAVALISHMPMLISQSLMNAVIDNDNAKTLASSGFRDMTRLSLSNKTMAKDMLELNRENIKFALKSVIDNANLLLQSEYFSENIDKIIDTREKLYNKNGKNIFKSND